MILEWLIIKIGIYLVKLLLAVKLLEFFFIIASKDCPSSDLYGIIVFLNFTIVPLHVILSPLLKVLGIFKMLGKSLFDSALKFKITRICSMWILLWSNLRIQLLIFLQLIAALKPWLVTLGREIVLRFL